MLSVETFPSNPLGLNLGSEAGPACMILYPQARFARLGLFASLRDAPDLFEAVASCTLYSSQARFARLGLRASLRDVHDLFRPSLLE